MSNSNLSPLPVSRALALGILRLDLEVWFARLARFPREYRRGRISMIDYETGDVHVKFLAMTLKGMELIERILRATDTVLVDSSLVAST